MKKHNYKKVKTKRISRSNSKNVYKYLQKD